MKSIRNVHNHTLTACIAIGLVAGGGLTASAQRHQGPAADRPAIGQQEPGQRQHPGHRMGMTTEAQQQGIQQRGHTMARASKLLDMEVQGPDGQKLGDVDEIILSDDGRSVEHVIVSLDGADSVILSLDELSAKHDDDAVLLAQPTQQDLQQRQTADRARLRVLREDAHVPRRVSNVIGLNVLGTDGKAVGRINDLIIDTQTGRIMTAAVRTGGILGMGSRLSSVEWQQVNVAADGETVSSNISRDALSERSHRQREYWDRHAETLTAADQGGSRADRNTTAQIRRDIHASENMSVNARNVTIVTQAGRVTLRGPVNSPEERRLIGEIANRIAGAGNTDNQLEVRTTATID